LEKFLIAIFLSLFFFLQYEYVYRAIADYVDLYMNKEEEYEYSVPVGTLNNGTTKVRPHIPFHCRTPVVSIRVR
jgi:hypothetical protein